MDTRMIEEVDKLKRAKKHLETALEADDGIFAFKMLKTADKGFRFVIASRNVANAGGAEPFGFNYGPSINVEMVLLGDDEYRSLLEGKMLLPDGWSLDEAVDLL